MKRPSLALLARVGPPILALAALLVAAPANAAERVADPSAGWHGRAVQNPQPAERLDRTRWPKGWSAGSVGLGTGYVRPGGSRRVRQVQRHLRQLGYRPGPVDGLFGPRTRAATRWFQYKHGLKLSGRVSRPTLTVLRARAAGKPLPTRSETTTTTPPPREPAAPETPAATPPSPPATPSDGGQDPVLFAVLLILVALAVGVLVGTLVPDLLPRRRRRAEPEPVTVMTAPAQSAAPVAEAPRVLGYATANGDREQTDTAVATLALRCARRGWTLVEVVRDTRAPGGRLAERPGLVYALQAIRGGTADGLVVARLSDFTARIADLATLLQWLDEADAFLDVADHPLDTSTRLGKATGRAVIELGGWERQRITRSTREDLASGRFTPQPRIEPDDLVPQIAAMHERGLSLRAIANALNLAGLPTPPGQPRWQTTDVKAATEGRHRT
jgi:DNA invertase Pin-like site-specific DNA recombinase